MSNPGGTTALSVLNAPTTPNSFYAFFQTQSSNRQSLQIKVVDTYANLTTKSTLESGYILQKLTPNKTYRLTFNIERQIVTTDPGGGTVTSYEIIDEARNLNPLSNSVDKSITSASPGTFFWDAATQTELLFKTLEVDNTAISTREFTSTRGQNNEPSPGVIEGFVTNARLVEPVNADGTFDASMEPIDHTFDAYLFIFEKPADTDLTDAQLTSRLNPTVGGYIGHTPGNDAKGVRIIDDVHSISSTNERNITLNANQFQASGDFPTSAGELAHDKQYYLAFALYNKTANYIVTNSSNQIKWHKLLIPFGGVWSITLGAFREYTINPLGGLHNSTAISVDIDGLGVVGAINNQDTYRITITATPTPI